MSDIYRVTYASAGCLPEGEPEYFPTIEAAAESVVDSHDSITWIDDSGYVDAATAGIVVTAGDVIEAGGVLADPTPGSLYAWTIEQVDEDEHVPNDDVATMYLERHGNLAVPCSRYGRDTSECASVALVLESIMSDATGESSTFRALEFNMGLVVNDSDDVARLLAENASDEQLDSIGQDRDSVLEWAYGDKETCRLEALRAFLGSDDFTPAEVEAEEIEPTTWDDSTFDAFGNTYRVLDDSEADSAVLDETRETLWAFNAEFLAGYMPEGIDASEIDAIRGDRCEDSNAAMLALVGAGPSDLETIARDYAAADGRGHALAGYDGEEHEVEHAGRTWFIYRTN